MVNDYKKNLFRLSAVLYGDGDYDIKSDTIFRKVLESILLDLDEDGCSYADIEQYASDSYHIMLTEDFIGQIVNKNHKYFDAKTEKSIKYLTLKKNRRHTLESKIDQKTIGKFIDEFLRENPDGYDHPNTKELIYDFLYRNFSSNVKSFEKLENSENGVKCLEDTTPKDYNATQKDVINSFLRWENPEKDKAIFAVRSYALEYCMITNNRKSNSSDSVKLRNKIFYLDTNIIYRIIGVDGVEKQEQIRKVIQKFVEFDGRLIISKETDREFKEGLKKKIRKIKEIDSPWVDPQLFMRLGPDEGFLNFFNKWKYKRRVSGLNFFEAYVKSIYDKFKSEFDIELDFDDPFDCEEGDTIDFLRDYESDIARQKGGLDRITGSPAVDARNVLWVECKRGQYSNTIFDTKYFLLSTDTNLSKWDIIRNEDTSVVIMPDQWLGVLLKYVGRGDDDFKSFVSFLNLRNNEEILSDEDRYNVLEGISEVSKSIEEQESLYHHIVNEDFKEGLKNKNKKETIEYTKECGENHLQEEVNRATVRISSLEKQVEIVDVKLQEERNNSSVELKNKDEQLLKKENEYQTERREKEKERREKEKERREKEKERREKEKERREKEKLVGRLVDAELRSWRRVGWWLLIPIFIVDIHLIICGMNFFYPSWNENYVSIFIEKFNAFENDFYKNLFWIIIGVITTFAIGTFKYVFYCRCLSRSKKETKLISLREKVQKSIMN